MPFNKLVQRSMDLVSLCAVGSRSATFPRSHLKRVVKTYRRWFLCALGAGLSVTLTFGPAWAQNLQNTTTDVVIDVKGVVIRLPNEGGDLQHITFSNWELSERLSLKDVSAQPDEARSFFERNTQISLSIPNLSEMNGPFLNRFPRDDYRTLRASVVIGRDAKKSCSALNEESQSTRMKAVDTSNEGWRKVNSLHSPHMTVFIPVSSVGQPRSMPGLTCDGFQRCAASICIGDKASFSFQFSEHVYPIATWLCLGSRIDRLIDYLLPHT